MVLQLTMLARIRAARMMFFFIVVMCYDIRFAVTVRSMRLVVVENFLSHWRPKLVQMDLR